VVEEKRQLIEYQLKEELYNWREDVRPRVVGKFDEKGEWALLAAPAPTAARWTTATGCCPPPASSPGDDRPGDRRAHRALLHVGAHRAAAGLPAGQGGLLGHRVFAIDRVPTFCPGCPHNTSTHVPDGSRALAGIGCHYMASFMPDRRTATFSHMGGEGVPWVGQAPFTDERHIFANLGDGTYFHSGILAIRQAVAAFNRPATAASRPAASPTRSSSTTRWR
jgi:indolepyruvate ferredoxin oxidoreductase